MKQCRKDCRLPIATLSLLLFFPFAAIALGAPVVIKDTTSIDDQAGLFARKCSGCHTVGGGKLTGPDLIGVSSWQPSEVQIKIKAMEKSTGPLTEGDISGLTLLLKDAQAKARVEKAGTLLLAATLKSLEPANSETGRKLFVGEAALSAGGPSCVGCHSVDRWGGSLGPNLTQVGARMGQSALISALRNSDFKIMRALFKEQPITAQEAVHLAKYFGDIKDRKPAAQSGMSGTLHFAGLSGALVFLCALRFLARRPYRNARVKLLALVRQRK